MTDRAVDYFTKELHEQPEKSELMLRHFFIHLDECEICKPKMAEVMQHVMDEMCPIDKEFIEK